MSLSVALLRDGFGRPLEPLGFSRVGRRQVWIRECPGFAHAVSMERYAATWTVRWDVVNPRVGHLLHGVPVVADDVRYSGFISGTARVAFRKGATEDEPLINAVSGAVAEVAAWFSDFMTVQQTIEFLTQDPGEKLRDPRVTVPSNWALRIFTAAALAVTERQESAADLVERATEAMGSSSDVARERTQRLFGALS